MDNLINGESSSQEINSENQNEHTQHCDKCINFENCKRILRKTRPEDNPTSCPIIHCLFNCGHQFHECKKEEHELLCPKVKVPCINWEYGCPLILERSQKGIHLETCPARYIYY